MGQERLDNEPQITLQELTVEDAGKYFNLIATNSDHFANFDNMPTDKYKTVEDVRRIFRNKDDKMRWGIVDKDDTLIGTINITPKIFPRSNIAEIGYLVSKDHTGMGYATEAVKKLARMASTQYDRLRATTHPENIASQAVLQKTGFIELGVNEEGDLVFELELRGGLR